jgi:hypothetical protein
MGTMGHASAICLMEARMREQICANCQRVFVPEPIGRPPRCCCRACGDELYNKEWREALAEYRAKREQQVEHQQHGEAA